MFELAQKLYRNMDFQQNIIKNISLLMKIKGLSQTDLRLKSEIDKSAMSQYLSGKREIGSTRLRKIAEALEVPVDYLTATNAENHVEEMRSLYATLSIPTQVGRGVESRNSVSDYTENEKLELIEKAYQMKEKGMISEEEFKQYKEKILNF